MDRKLVPVSIDFVDEKLDRIKAMVSLLHRTYPNRNIDAINMDLYSLITYWELRKKKGT